MITINHLYSHVSHLNIRFPHVNPLGIPLNEEVIYGTYILHLYECCIIFTVYTIIKYFCWYIYVLVYSHSAYISTTSLNLFIFRITLKILKCPNRGFLFAYCLFYFLWIILEEFDGAIAVLIWVVFYVLKCKQNSNVYFLNGCHYVCLETVALTST